MDERKEGKSPLHGRPLDDDGAIEFTPGSWNQVIQQITKLADDLKANTELPNGREKSLVLTKLDEARLWAGEAIEQKYSGTHGQRHG